MKIHLSLQYILTRNYILLAVLPVLLFGGVTLMLLSRNLSQEINEKNQALAISVAGEVQTFLREPLSLIRQVRKIVSSSGVITDDGMVEYLETVVDSYPFFEMVQLINKKGIVTHVAPYEEEYIGTDMSRQAFYTATYASGEPFWSPTFISMRSGAPTISVSVTTEGGMIVGYLNLVTLGTIVEKVSDVHKYVVITDQEGTVIADIFSLRVQHRENLSSFHQIRTEHDSGGNNDRTFTLIDRNKKVIASAASVPLTEWEVIFLQDYDDAFAPLRESRFTLLVAILLTLAFAVLAAVAGANATSTPLTRLLKNVRRVAEGEYALTYESTDVRGYREIKELDENFRQMTEAIRQRELNILESEQTHRELVEALPHGLQENDLNGIITFTNAAYDRIFECEPGEALGNGIWETEISPEKKDKLKSDLCRLIREQPVPKSRISKAVTYQGNLIDIQVDWQYKRDPGGKLLGFISVITDITEKKHLELNLRQAQKMEAIGTLAGGIAHDFNNILSAILGYSQMLLESQPEGSRNREFQEQVIKASLRARDLVQHLLIFSRKQEQTKVPVEVHKVVQEATRFLRATLPTTITFDLNISEDIGTIDADATQLHQVILNLCTNAAHAMEESGGVLSISLSHAIFTALDSNRPPELEPGSYVQLVVKDTGKGIAPKLLDRIFDPFFTTKEVGKGTGMGLAVVHGIITGHGGTIQVESELEVGTVFRIYLPTGGASEVVHEEIDAPPAGNNEHILIVDDEKDITTITSMMLNDAGYRTTSFSDPRKALAAFRRASEEFDLIVTDQTMPGLTGVELALEIRAGNHHLPMLLCTGYSSTITSEQLERAGINQALMKPLDRDTLLRAVSELLEGRVNPS